jgi:hypothetical protein
VTLGVGGRVDRGVVSLPSTLQSRGRCNRKLDFAGGG